VAGVAFRQLQEQLEAVRKEAYAEGWEACAVAVRKFVSASQPPERSSAEKSDSPHSFFGEADDARPRGTNRRLVAAILRAAHPRAVGPTTIVRIIKKQNGLTLSYSSVRNALRQLESGKEVEEVNDTKTWRYIGSQQTGEPSPEGTSNGSA
jgi:hypothetical protein